MPKIVDHGKTRDEILTQSYELFARKGFSVITMREIAAELGISTGTLYHYFDSKESIFQQMLQQLSTQDVLEAVSILPAMASVEQRLDIFFQFVSLRETYFQNLIFIILDYFRHGSPGSMEVIRDTARYYRDAICEHVGESDPQLGSLIFSIVLGMILQRIMDSEAVRIDEHAELTATMFCAYLKSRND